MEDTSLYGRIKLSPGRAHEDVVFALQRYLADYCSLTGDSDDDSPAIRVGWQGMATSAWYNGLDAAFRKLSPYAATPTLIATKHGHYDRDIYVGPPEGEADLRALVTADRLGVEILHRSQGCGDAYTLATVRYLLRNVRDAAAGVGPTAGLRGVRGSDDAAARLDAALAARAAPAAEPAAPVPPAPPGDDYFITAWKTDDPVGPADSLYWSAEDLGRARMTIRGDVVYRRAVVVRLDARGGPGVDRWHVMLFKPAYKTDDQDSRGLGLFATEQEAIDSVRAWVLDGREVGPAPVTAEKDRDRA